MSDNLKPGDLVEWKTPQGKTSGRVRKKLTTRTKIKTHLVAATREDPEFLVSSEKSGALAAHKPAALKEKKQRK